MRSSHLTGLYLLAPHLTAENAEALLADARGKTRREIEVLLARWFPRPDVLPSVTPIPSTESSAPSAIPGTSAASASSTIPRTTSAPTAPFRLEPLSASSYRIEFTASAELHDKLELARNLLSHAIPSGDLAALFERALARARCGAEARAAHPPGARATGEVSWPALGRRWKPNLPKRVLTSR